MLVYHPPPQKPKFVRIGRFIYMLRTIYFISKTSLLLKQNENKTFAYLLSTSIYTRNFRAPEPEDGSIILNDINSLIEYSLEFYKLVEGIEYKINILSNLYHNIENDKQLLNYNGNVLFVKVTETTQSYNEDNNSFKQYNENINMSSIDSVNKEQTNNENNNPMQYANHINNVNNSHKDWNGNNNNNQINLSTTDNGYINSTNIIHQKNNPIFNNSSSTNNNLDSISQHVIHNNNGISRAKSCELSQNYVNINFNNPQLDNIKHKPRLLIKTKQNPPKSGNNDNNIKGSTVSAVVRQNNNNNNKIIISNISASPSIHKSNKSFYVKASFYPQMVEVPPSANSVKKTQKRNQSFSTGNECYYNYSSGNISLNNNNNINNNHNVNKSPNPNPNENTLCVNNDFARITSKRNTMHIFNEINKQLNNKKNKHSNLYPKILHCKQIKYIDNKNNNDDNKEETNNSNTIISSTFKNNKTDIVNDGFIATKLFPIRGRLRLNKRLLKKSSSLPLIHNNSLTPNNNISNNNNELPPFLLKPHIHIHGNDLELNEEDKINLIKTFLLSKNNSPSHYPSNTYTERIKEHINENIKNEYTEFLLELRQCVLRNIHNIITDSVISSSPNMNSSLQYIKEYQSSFPFKQCIKEFILYSYLSSFCKCNINELFQNISYNNNDENNNNNTKTNDKNEIINSIQNMKKHLETIIEHSHKNKTTDILTYCRSHKDEIVMNTSFFEVFILCADYFNGYQNLISKIVLQIIGVGCNTISYELFSCYYLYFRCFDLVTNEQKFQFVKKIVNLVKDRMISIKSDTLLNMQIELRNILDIDEYTLSIFESGDIRYSKMDLARRYAKIDLIYLKLVNYFTYQH